ncbi:hypothetical protein [Streptomyces sp. L2]|uniref:hypothetical protein n=1 Tax=Streptomyces sp. L2 TaxID=2162665 RepID=UPI001F50A718|nr:hypothetical protein [Streptomyces sp. L2]
MSSPYYADRPPAEVILAAVPGLAPYARPAVVFEPVTDAGEPGHLDSSIGGPLLWPPAEPWPHCTLPDEREPSGLPPTAMVPVVQIHRRDAPGDWWPPGTDVFQMLWCPNAHEAPPAPHVDANPVVEIRWRRSADLPQTPYTPPLPVRQEDEDYGFSPRPCRLTPVPLTDFPYPEELPDDLADDVDRLVRESSGEDGDDVITRVPGCKFGGWPTWHLAEPMEIRCGTCDSVMTLLFTVASDHTTHITVGRWGDLRVFSCPADLRHGYQFDVH